MESYFHFRFIAIDQNVIKITSTYVDSRKQFM